MELTKKKVVFGVLSVLLIWFFSAIIIDSIYDSSDRGTFGDMFGAVNALFSGLALFGIIVSILIQQKELNLQRLELSDTRKEFKVNRITNILFKQVEYLNNHIKSIKFYTPGLKLKEEYINIDILIPFLINNKPLINSIIEHNTNGIMPVINNVLSVVDSFQKILDSEGGLNEKERRQIKMLFVGNINVHFVTMLELKVEIIKDRECKFKINKLINFLKE
ncbi:hypothetical protein [Tenacibaculum larymnensis]|uniref:Phage abortive infection protein n=1 Tax=Tenacibaculum larymnensis TaxID=2878201 RepID=A0A9X4EUF1_9FLAO|nr:hypothetical protein [Tenacibaculum larymnensis]MDE1206566.1 hypothetical protein [Tenacibaculum larymnensis]